MEICRKEDCFGCYACSNICPKGCITMNEDNYGYIYPKINMDKCINCNLCKKVCPAINEDKFNSPNIVFAGWAKKKDERESSTSGGAASIFSNIILEESGVVYGASVVDSEVKHIEVIEKSNISILKGSKYVHSKIEDNYKKCEQKLKSGIKVLFIGTPCQISGLKHFLRRDYENLFTIDIICHGVPSMKMLNEYLRIEGISSDYTNIQFRDENGFNLTVIKNNKKVFVKPMKESLYYLGFMKGVFYRENCYKCRYAQEKRISDITIGDFWGLGEGEEFKYSKKGGVSLILSNTKKGEMLINRCKKELCLYKRSLYEAVNGNAQLRKPSIKHKNYYKFRKAYLKKGFVSATKKALLNDMLYDKLRDVSKKNEILYAIAKRVKKIIR